MQTYRTTIRIGSLTHIRLAAVCSASVTAHFGGLDRLSQGDGVGLVLFIHILAIIVFLLAMLKIANKERLA